MPERRLRRWAIAGFVLAALAALFFAVKLTFAWRYWHDDAHRNVAPAGWMTPGYLARSHGVPRDALIDALPFTLAPGHRRTLADIAREQHQSLDSVLQQFSQTLDDLHGTGGQDGRLR